ncbi:Gfo/Idh/MocA family oxidoreductase [Kitasatospora sp. NPDC096077]|uniref:Gfo/Idh/MocA family protein n=1 Tax=Kitasatospora sp. NPDC096077 TaxID=3155544 RepID=UPI00331E1D90
MPVPSHGTPAASPARGTGPAADPVLRLGVLGCAGIARRRMLPAMAAHYAVELRAVASRSADRAAATAVPYGARPVTGYAELLADPSLDAVYLPLPAALHARWVAAALDAGKHVLAEKPLTTDPARTRALLERARALGLVLRENTMFVHHGQHAAVRRLLADGAIGEPRVLHAAFTVPAPPEGDIRYDPELDGGCLADIGLYPVRAAVHLLGTELDVAGAVLSATPGRRVETSGAALLRRADGVSAQLTFGMEHAYRSRYELWGSEGRITVDRAFTPAADHRPRLLLERASGTETVTLPAEDQAAATLTAFAAAVHGRPGGAGDEVELLAQADLLARIRRTAASGSGR